MSTDEGLWTRERVAEYCDLHARTIDRLVRRGELRAIRIGRAVRFRPEDVRALGVEVER